MPAQTTGRWCFGPVERYLVIAGQCRATKDAQIDVNDHMRHQAGPRGYAARRLYLHGVTLTVTESDGVGLEALVLGNCERSG